VDNGGQYGAEFGRVSEQELTRIGHMHPIEQHWSNVTRRHFFARGALGLGTAALASLWPSAGQASSSLTPAGGLPELPHFAPRAKRAIYLFMSGAPSQIDMFDYKPKMKGLFDTDLPKSIRMGQRLTTMTSGQSRFPIAPSIYNFAQYGQSGAWVSELMPHTAK